ncbi:MAG: zf-HC2 domain-containing protein [Pyrinomonadaceae bacterium]
MSCELTERVSLLVDGELAPAELHEVERHLLTCADCQQARLDFVNLRQQIIAYPVLVDYVAQRRALAQILAGQHGTAARDTGTNAARWRERLFGSRGPARFNPAWAAAVALLIVACAVAVVVYRNTQRHTAIAGTSTNSNSGHTPEAQPTPADRRAEVANAPNAKQQPAPSGAQNNERGDQQQAGVNNRASRHMNKQPVAQTANAKSPLVRPERLPQVARESTPAYVNANAVNVAASALNRSADAETLTVHHVEQAELLLRTFRNARADVTGAAADLSYEKRRAHQLLYQNIVLRREATSAGNVQVATLLDSLEPILLDIANLPAHARDEDVRAIKERVQRKNLVALLQVNSTALARAYEE